MEIIITDLTRFNTGDKVCISGINLSTSARIRPMPYLTSAECENLNILPGSKLSGDFKKVDFRGLPHSEDHYYKNLSYNGPCTAEEFHAVLKNSISSSIADGFDYEFEDGEKSIPNNTPPLTSIITLKVKASQVRIVKDKFKPGKIKLHFDDNDGKSYAFMPITDLGFFNYAMAHFKDFDFPEKINDFLDEQEELYLRIGLSGEWKDVYWLQVNGIYTFPNFDEEIRSY